MVPGLVTSTDRHPPTVAVLAGHFPADRASIHRAYLNAVWLAGGQPVILAPPPPGALNPALDVLERCQAVLLTGGGDIDPARYGQDVGARIELMEVDPARDAFELAAIDRTLAARLPLLGICRGLQLLAVALGGRLHQDLDAAGYPGHWREADSHLPAHALTAVPGSLAEVALGGRTSVNSVHHQAVADPGEHLVATARTEDGLIEAVEGAPGSGYGPLLGLQWHPERMACPPEGREADPAHLAPFRWLVEAAGGSGSGVERVDDAPATLGRSAWGG
jgi:putative glutamine amidotransferase